MTISTGTMVSDLLVPAESAAGGLLAEQLATQPVTAEDAEGMNLEGQFWAMVNQQLTEIVTQEDAQVIENKDLLAMFEAFEADLESVENEADIPVQWMQFLKSHFENDKAVVQVDNAGIDIESLPANENQPEIVLPVIQVTQSNQVKVEAEAGEDLPRPRQVVSAVLPIADEKTESISIHREPALNLAAKGEQVQGTLKQSAKGMAEDMMPLAEHVELEEVPDQSLEKNRLKPAVPDMLNNPIKNDVGINHKSADAMSAVQLNPVASAQLQTPAQTLASQHLPSALQSLQLNPQTPSSQWGDALGERVSFLINNKLNNAEIRIDPPHLGKLDIQIQVKEDSALIVINTQHAQTRDLIDAASVRLREVLQDAGYASVDVDVSHREQSMAQDGNNSQDQSSMADLNQGEAGHSESTDSIRTEMAVHLNDGRIDYFA